MLASDWSRKDWPPIGGGRFKQLQGPATSNQLRETIIADLSLLRHGSFLFHCTFYPFHITAKYCMEENISGVTKNGVQAQIFAPSQMSSDKVFW